MEFVLVVAGTLSLLLLSSSWKSYAVPSASLRPSRKPVVLHSAILLICVAILLFVLTRWSASEVRADPAEVIFYLAFCLGWIFLAQELLAVLGISWRDDFVERRNAAVVPAFAGFLIGTTFCVAGANIGEGPGLWVVVVCAALAKGSLVVCWLLLAWISRAADTISIERDLGCGIRVGGFLFSSGLVLGISVAGDWKSLSGVFADFTHVTWPLWICLVAFSWFESLQQKRALGKKGLGVAASAMIAAGMMAVAATYTFWVGIR